VTYIKAALILKTSFNCSEQHRHKTAAVVDLQFPNLCFFECPRESH